MMNANGSIPAGGGNPNLVPLTEKQELEKKFDEKIATESFDKPYIYRDRLKRFALALQRHDDVSTALTDSRLVQLCFHILDRLDKIEVRLDKLEKDCGN